jgi:hypothetical protein
VRRTVVRPADLPSQAIEFRVVHALSMPYRAGGG